MKNKIQSCRSWNVLLCFVSAVTSTTSALPVITVQPQDQAVSLFADASFHVSATDTQAISFQWLFNGAPVAGEVTNSLSITNVQRTYAGAYAVIISDPSGSLTSRVATLSIVPFNALYCFGYSWTDTQGFLGNSQYWQGRSGNGPMWPEFLSTNLGLAYAPANNRARIGATSADVLNQVVSASLGAKPALNLYVLWAGDSDFLYAADANYSGSVPYIPWTNDVAWNGMIQTALRNNSNAVERLYSKGARAIVVQNLDDFSRHPALIRDFGNDTNRVQAFRLRTETFNSELDSALQSIARDKPDFRLLVLDMYSNLNAAQNNFASYGFTKVFPNALDDGGLKDKSFGGPGQDYFYWDGLHGTSKLNALIATWGFTLLTNSVSEMLDVSFSSGFPQIQMNRLQIGRDYKLESSGDLAQWRELASFTASAGTNQWSDTSPGQTATFYRLTWHR